jgi:hypothetical protein
MKTIFIPLILTAATAATLFGQSVSFKSGPKQVSLVELYTSEGCSSCPPAEYWLNRLKSSPSLWNSFVPVAFHVDYWNSAGWKDRWSSPQFSLRQSDYAQQWHADNVYTPCFVLNGSEWLAWRFRKEPPAASGVDVGVLEVHYTGTNRWSATFAPVVPLRENLELHATLLAGGIESNVRGGENSGRDLHHEFAALDLISIGMFNDNGIGRSRFIVNVPRDNQKKALALAVWITRPGELAPLQAAGEWLPQLDGTEK